MYAYRTCGFACILWLYLVICKPTYYSNALKYKKLLGMEVILELNFLSHCANNHCLRAAAVFVIIIDDLS